MIASLLRTKRGSITAAAAGFTAFLNIYSLQTLLPLLGSTFGAGDREVGLAISATTLAVALASPFAGWLVGRLTRGALTKLSVGGLFFCGVQVALANHLSSLIFWRFCQGLFLPILIAGVLTFLAEDFEPKLLSRATSNYVTWTIVGGFAGRWISGLVASDFGWRSSLLTLAILNAVAGGALLLSLDAPNKRVAGKKPPTVGCFLQTFRRAELRTAYLIGFGSLFTMVGAFTYVTFYLAQWPFNLGPDGLGRMFCVYLLGIAVTPSVGKVLAQWGHAKLVRRTSKLALLGLLLTLLPKVSLIGLGLALVCVSGFATQACVSSFLADLPNEVKAVACGLYLSFYYFGGCLGGALPGLAWECWGWWGCVGLFGLVQWSILFLSRHLHKKE